MSLATLPGDGSGGRLRWAVLAGGSGGRFWRAASVGGFGGRFWGAASVGGFWRADTVERKPLTINNFHKPRAAYGEHVVSASC